MRQVAYLWPCRNQMYVEDHPYIGTIQLLSHAKCVESPLFIALDKYPLLLRGSAISSVFARLTRSGTQSLFTDMNVHSLTKRSHSPLLPQAYSDVSRPVSWASVTYQDNGRTSSFTHKLLNTFDLSWTNMRPRISSPIPPSAYQAQVRPNRLKYLPSVHKKYY